MGASALKESAGVSIVRVARGSHGELKVAARSVTICPLVVTGPIISAMVFVAGAASATETLSVDPAFSGSVPRRSGVPGFPRGRLSPPVLSPDSPAPPVLWRWSPPPLPGSFPLPPALSGPCQFSRVPGGPLLAGPSRLPPLVRRSFPCSLALFPHRRWPAGPLRGFSLFLGPVPSALRFAGGATRLPPQSVSGWLLRGFFSTVAAF